MGQNDREQSRKENRRNSSNKSKLGGVGKSLKGGDADYTAVNAEVLLRAVANFTRGGGAIQFGYTSDGGAFSVNTYEDGERNKFYPTNPEEMEVLCVEIAEAYADK